MERRTKEQQPQQRDEKQLERRQQPRKKTGWRKVEEEPIRVRVMKWGTVSVVSDCERVVEFASRAVAVTLAAAAVESAAPTVGAETEAWRAEMVELSLAPMQLAAAFVVSAGGRQAVGK
jgi:hypothetical protein